MRFNVSEIYSFLHFVPVNKGKIIKTLDNMTKQLCMWWKVNRNHQQLIFRMLIVCSLLVGLKLLTRSEVFVWKPQTEVLLYCIFLFSFFFCFLLKILTQLWMWHWEFLLEMHASCFSIPAPINSPNSKRACSLARGEPRKVLGSLKSHDAACYVMCIYHICGFVPAWLVKAVKTKTWLFLCKYLVPL